MSWYDSVDVADERVKAYAAALVDGEGSIQIQRTQRGKYANYLPSVTVAMTKPDAVALLGKYWGSPARRYTPISSNAATKGWDSQYVWRLNGSKVHEFLKDIRPYLTVKKEQCDLVLEYLSVQPVGRPRVSEEERQRRTGLYLKMRELNHKSSNRSKAELTKQAFEVAT